MKRTQPFALVSQTTSVRDNLRARSVHGVFATALGSGGDFLLRLASIAVLARLVIPEHFGLVGMVTAITAMAQQLGQLGLSAATVQCTEITHKQASNLFWINTGAGLVLVLALSALAPFLASFYHEPRLVLITMVIATSVLGGGLAVQHEALLARQMKQEQLALIRVGATFLSAILAISLALAHVGYWALVIQEVARSFLISVGAWVACPWVPSPPSRGARLGSLLRFGRDLTLTQFLNAVVSNLDRVLISRYLGAVPVGIYRQAQQLMMVPIDQLQAPIQSVAQPALSLLQNDPDRYRRYYRRMVTIVGLATMPLAAFAAVYAEEVTLLLIGEKWAGAAPLLRLFALAAFIRPVLGTSGTVLITCGRPHRLLHLALIRNATLVLLIAADLRWGAKGVATAQLATTLLLTLPCLLYSFKGTAVTVGAFFAALRTPLTASAVMAAGLVLVHHSLPVMGNVTSLALGCAVGGALYLAVCLLVPGGRGELGALLHDIKSSLPRRTLPDPA